MKGGEHAWKRVLFDTNMVSRWMLGDLDFQAPLKTLVRKLERVKAHFFISAVTVQELLVFARITRGEQQALTFLSTKFTTLPFDHRGAMEAARIGASQALARGAPQAERDLWHRDIAILGTASVHDMNAVVTANGRDFLPFRELVSCDIHVVEKLTRRGGGR
jgi:predicted nucleic acid-binding protein